jgi:hypothetical protein
MLEQDVNGEPHVLVPKDVWVKIWEVFNKIEKMGE